MKRDANHPWKRTGRCLAAGLLALGLSASLVPGAAAAQPEDLPEWVGSPVKPTASLQDQKELPAKFDLRDRGVVTPVKIQNPWGSCWSFGCIAAAESSILSYLGQTWQENRLDLSEKHLAWFAVQPVTADEAGPEQAGEGLQLVDESKNGTNAVYDVGGFSTYVTTLFSSGVGPEPEAAFPYRGAEGRTLVDDLEAALGGGESYDAKELADMRANDVYSDKDDWTIPRQAGDGASNRNLFSGFTLRDGNILPRLTTFDWETRLARPNGEGVRAAKEELLAGHGVCISYCAADQFLYKDNWAQYAYVNEPANHTVCIVGWDDTYPKENFSPDYRLQPKGDGAWIVKNSWGSEDPNGMTELANGSTVGKNDWGIVEKDKDGKEYHTGYFYLSYYDNSIYTEPETMAFTDDMAGISFCPMQYDYMPAMDGLWDFNRDDPVATANVFTAEQDMLLTSVSTRTTVSDSIVTMSVYLLDQDAKPAEGNLAAQLDSVKVPYAGYHRMDLPKPVPVRKGQRFSVVSCVINATDENGRPVEYGASANRGRNRDKAIELKSDVYCTAKVNPGESWISYQGRWDDWYDVQNKSSNFRTVNEGYEIDNFSIKAYGVPWEAPAIRDPYLEDGEVGATFSGGTGRATAVCAFYNGEGQMVGSRTVSFTGERFLRFPLEGVKEGEPGSARLFLLDENSVPLCGNETIDLTKTNAG